MSRRDYQKLIEDNLKSLTGKDYHYLKNSKEMYVLLKEHGDMKGAIRNAKRLVENFKGRQDYTNHNPCTMVWRLVEELLEIK